MAAIAIAAAQPKAVNPRTWYVNLIDEGRARTRKRLLLTRFVSGGPADDAAVGRALAGLGQIAPFSPAFRVGDLACFRRNEA